MATNWWTSAAMVRCGWVVGGLLVMAGCAPEEESGDDDMSEAATDTPAGDDDASSSSPSPEPTQEPSPTLPPTPTPDPSQHCGTISEDEVWTLANSPHTVTCSVVVEGESGPVLTIEPGVEVLFSGGAGLLVGSSYPGGLQASGTAEKPIVLKAAADVGLWAGVQFGSATLSGGAVLKQLSMVDGGNAFGAALTSVGAPVRVEEVTIRGWQGAGFSMTGAGFDAQSSGFVVTDNGGAVGSLETDFVGTLPEGSYQGNGEDVILLSGGNISQSLTLHNEGVAFLSETHLVVEGDASPVLTLEAGVELRFRAGLGIYVGNFGPGGLEVEGTPALPVVLTAADPTEPWAGIKFGAQNMDAVSMLTDFELAYAGGFGAAAVFQDASLPLSNGLIHDSSSYGICPDETSVLLLDNVTFQNNAQGNSCR